MHPKEDLLSPHFCMVAHLKRASRRADQLYEDQLRVVGLKGTQFTLLRTLSETGAIAMQSFADVLRMDRTTLTRNLKPLLKQDYLRVVPDTEDKRIKKVEITLPGLALLAQALPLWQQAQEQVIKYMGEETTVLLGLLKKMSQIS